MIAASILFLAAAIATFLLGVFSSGLQMIGVSIGCSVAAAALLLTGVLRDSKRRPAVASGSGAVSQADVATYATPSFREEVAAEPVYEPVTAAATEEPETDLWSQPEEEAVTETKPSWLPELTPVPEPPVVPAPARKPTARTRTAAKTTKTAAKKAAPKKPAAKSTAKKAAPKKAAAKTAAKPAAKSTAKKATAKKAAPKKAAPKKAAPKK